MSRETDGPVRCNAAFSSAFIWSILQSRSLVQGVVLLLGFVVVGETLICQASLEPQNNRKGGHNPWFVSLRGRHR